MKGSKDKFVECFWPKTFAPLTVQNPDWILGAFRLPKHDGEEFALSCLFVCFSALFSCIVSYYLCQIVIDHVSQFCSSLFIVFNGFVGGLLAQMAWDGLAVQTMMDPFKSG